MASTQKIFYERPGLFAAEARLLSVEGPADAPVLVLDRTIFYPEGGGQSCDLGTIGPFAGGDATEVASVTEEVSPAGELLVLHAMAGPCAAHPGDLVRLTVDRDRRLDYSQQHTAEHLIGSVALRLLGAHVVSVRFGPERSTIDFDLGSMPDEDIAAIEDEIERVVADDYPVRTHLCPPEDIASFPLRRRPPAGAGVLRVVEIDGIDFSPCCGLHLASTGALRLVRVLGTEKYKGMTRLYFVAGSRAAADHRTVSRIARESARTLGTSVPELSAAVSREAERRKAAELALGALDRERAAREAATAPELALPALPGGSPRVALRRYADRGADSLMESAKAYAGRGLVALLASEPDLTIQALSPTPEAGLAGRLKGPLAEAGGKGGGGPAAFRATFENKEGLGRFMETAEALLNEDTSSC
jgi:alanyl-tRNA synthetase